MAPSAASSVTHGLNSLMLSMGPEAQYSSDSEYTEEAWESDSDYAAVESEEATRIAAQAVGMLNNVASSLVKSLSPGEAPAELVSALTLLCACCGSEGSTGRRPRAPLPPLPSPLLCACCGSEGSTGRRPRAPLPPLPSPLCRPREGTHLVVRRSLTTRQGERKDSKSESDTLNTLVSHTFSSGNSTNPGLLRKPAVSG
jgi:hypothetical protein